MYNHYIDQCVILKLIKYISSICITLDLFVVVVVVVEILTLERILKLVMTSHFRFCFNIPGSKFTNIFQT